MKKLTIKERLSLAEERTERFRAARDMAEQLLEEKSRAVYLANQALQANRDNLQTEIEYATRELILSNERLAKALDEKSTFIGSISHEIRTPLYAIAGLSELLLDSDLDRNQKEYIYTIFESSIYLEKLLTDVLQISKIESGNVDLFPCPTNPKDTLNSLNRMFNSQAHKKGIELHCTLHDDLPEWIEIDDNRYRQIITNLISNALKNTHKGEINIHAEFRRNHNQPNSGWLVSTVSDTGIGIKPDDIKRIFGAYEQFGNLDQGVGLGLAICKKLTHLMGGELSCTSEVHIGSQFKLSIPIKLTSAPKEATISTEKEYDLSHLKILVAEDSFSLQHVIRAQLNKLGIIPTIVSNGQEALNSLAINEYDMAFLDINMPIMSGEEAIKIIKSSTHLNNNYCVALTAVNVSGSRNNILAMGFDDYQSKPITLAELKLVIYHYIEHLQ